MNNDEYILIDSSGILNEQYFGMKNVIDYDKKFSLKINEKIIPLYAIYGYMQVLKRIMERYSDIPNKNIIHVLDSNEGSLKRKTLYPLYKANRKEKEKDFLTQKNMLRYFVETIGQKFLQIKNEESDDVIGTLSKRISLTNKVYIFTHDKDLFQLLNRNTNIIREEKNKNTGFKDFCIYTENYVYKKYGFSPETIVDFLAFKGDISDNIPGVKGIGEKGAINLLNKYVNVENVILNIEEIENKYKQKIKEQKQALLLSKELALIQTNLDSVPSVEKIESVTNENMKKNCLEILKKLGVIEYEF